METRACNFTSFNGFMGRSCRGILQRPVRIADIGCGPKAEFGQNLRHSMSGSGIDLNITSVENALIDKSERMSGRVKFADVYYEKDRIDAGLFDLSQHFVFINNIVNTDLFAPAFQMLAKNGFLLATFALSDVQAGGDSPNIIPNSVSLLEKMGDERSRLVFLADLPVRMPPDYPKANSLYESAGYMLLAKKICL